MRRLLPFLVLTALVACDSAPGRRPVTQPAQAGMRSITDTPPQPAKLEPPPMLTDEAPPPKPKALPWETPTPIVFSPEDEKLRASLPFTPAIAMDPIDGSKISIRATTPTFQYKNKIYYFSTEANRHEFMANPEQYAKSPMMRL
jgi:YHS domain-containing protein